MSLSLILSLSVPPQQLLAGLGSEPLDCRQPPCLLYTNNLCSLKMVQGSRATLAINLPAKQTVAPQKHGLARPGGGGCWEGCVEEVGTPVRLAWNAVAEGKQALALKINHSHSQGRQREPHRGTNTHPLQWEIHTQRNTHWQIQTITEKFCSLTAVVSCNCSSNWHVLSRFWCFFEEKKKQLALNIGPVPL